MTIRRPTRSTGKCAFQALAQSASWTIAAARSPIGRSPKAWRWPSSRSARATAARTRGDVDQRQVGADERRPREVDARREPLVDELERRLDARPAGRGPGEDLGHGLDGLVVGGDRQLQPGTRRRGRGCEVDARERIRRGARRRPRRRGPGVTRGPASRAAPGGETASPRLLRVRLEQLALLLLSLRRDDDVGDHVEVAADRLAAEVGHAAAAEPDLGARAASRA